MSTNNSTKEITNFLFEVGKLRTVPRAGSAFAGIPQPESVADHTARSVFVGYILAHMESANPERVALICAFHEIGEVRIGDLHKIASSYFPNKKDVEKQVVKDQLSQLPEEIRNGFWNILEGEGEDSDHDHIVAKDADYIEMILTAKEYVEQGHAIMQNWIDNATKCLKTKSAKELAQSIQETNSSDWWKHLKLIKR